MAYIPESARWYLADIILEHVVENDPRNVVHVNTSLIQADSPEEAYAKALRIGSSEAREYLNASGAMVHVRFRGLRNLLVVYGDLDDGAELMYSEDVDVPEETLQRWIARKEELAVFEPRERRTGIPDLFPETIMRELEAEGFRRDEI